MPDVPKRGTWAATGVGEVRVDGGEERSELTSLGGGARTPAVGGDGLAEDREPNWKKKLKQKKDYKNIKII